MHEIQLASEGVLRYDPMDKCSLDLCRILPLLSLLNIHPSAFVAGLSDIPITILFAAARARSDEPTRSHLFREIAREVSLAQDIEAVHHDLFEDKIRATVPDDLRESGTLKYKVAIINDAARLLALTGIMRAASRLISLTLAFIDEWSDIQFGVDILAGCSSMAEISPFAEQDEEILKISLDLMNGLTTQHKRLFVLAMPIYFSLHDSSSQVTCSDGYVNYKELFDTREQERLHQTIPVIADPRYLSNNL